MALEVYMLSEDEHYKDEVKRLLAEKDELDLQKPKERNLESYGIHTRAKHHDGIKLS